MASQSILVICVMALVLRTNPANAVDCSSILASFFPCAGFLGSPVPLTPGIQCCNSANSVISMADTNDLCQCFRLSPLSPGFLPSKAQQIPNLCNLSSFLPLVNCLIPSSGSFVPLPPLE